MGATLQEWRQGLVLQEPQTTPPPDLSEPEVLRAQAELGRRFTTGGGCIASASVFALLLPDVPRACVEEALHRLCELGTAEMCGLADGSVVFRFPPR